MKITIRNYSQVLIRMQSCLGYDVADCVSSAVTVRVKINAFVEEYRIVPRISWVYFQNSWHNATFGDGGNEAIRLCEFWRNHCSMQNF